MQSLSFRLLNDFITYLSYYLINGSPVYLINENLKKFHLKEEDQPTCVESCIQDPFCLGYGHISPVDCILIISNLSGNFTIVSENMDYDYVESEYYNDLY